MPQSPDSTAPPAVPSSSVTWLGLILSALLLLALMGLLSAGVAYWGWKRLAAEVTLKDQRADIVLPPELAVSAKVTNTIRIKLDHKLAVHVPIKQDLLIPVTDPIPLKVHLDTEVPVNIDVPIDQTLHVEQLVDVHTRVSTRFMGIPITLPVDAKVPVKADIPVKLVIPVRRRIPLSLTMPATVQLADPIRARIDTVFDSTVPVRADLSLPVVAPVSAKLSFPQQVVNVGVQSMQASLPLEAIKLTPR